MNRRWIAGAAAAAVGTAAAVRARRPTLMDWPGAVRPVVVAGVATGSAAVSWLVVDTVLRAPGNPGVLVRRPAALLGMLAVGGVASRIGRRLVVPRMVHVGRTPDPALASAPSSSTVSGGPGSLVAYPSVGREGARYVHTAVAESVVRYVMAEPLRRVPIRVFVGLDAGETPQDRVELAMRELHRLGAFDRSMLLVQAPAGSGYANPTPSDVMEIAMRGDCASVVVGYGLLPSFLSLDRIPMAARTQKLLLDAVMAELVGRPPDRRPRLVLYGESLGARVQQDALDAAGIEESPIDAALWVGTPGGRAADLFRSGLASPPVVLDRPAQLPTPLPRPHPRVWFLEHDGDPVVRLRRDLLHRRPGWLAAGERGRHVPTEMAWTPGLTWLQVLVDTLFATQVKPGDFDSRGHDYRADLGAVVCAAFDLPRDAWVDPGAPGRLEEALRELEIERARRFGG